jgi:hypothetical protein
MPERTFVGGNYHNRETPNKLPQWAIDAQNRPYTPPSEPPGNRLIGGNFEGRDGQKLPSWATNNARNVETQIAEMQDEVTQQAINSRNYDSRLGNDVQEYGIAPTIDYSDIPFNNYVDDIHQFMNGYYHR